MAPAGREKPRAWLRTRAADCRVSPSLSRRRPWTSWERGSHTEPQCELRLAAESLCQPKIAYPADRLRGNLHIVLGIHTHKHMHAHTHARTHTHTHTHTRIHAHIHTHGPS